MREKSTVEKVKINYRVSDIIDNGSFLETKDGKYMTVIQPDGKHAWVNKEKNPSLEDFVFSIPPYDYFSMEAGANLSNSHKNKDYETDPLFNAAEILSRLKNRF